MKKLLTICVLTIMGVSQSLAEDVRVDGIAYNIIDEVNNYVEVTAGCSNIFGNYVIPAYVEDGDTRYKVKRIGDSAFFYQANVQTIEIKDGLTEIVQWGISYNPNLTSLKLPKTLRTLGNGALCNNQKMKSLIFPEGLAEIGTYVCDGCKSLSAITLPSTLTMVSKGAFQGCPVANVYCYATVPPTLSSKVFDSYEGITLHVLPGCAAAYEEDYNWGQCTIVEDCGEEATGISRLQPTPAAQNTSYDLNGKAVRSAKGVLVKSGKKILM